MPAAVAWAPSLALYLAVARRSFRRYSTYLAATAAGLFTNSVFGLIYSFAYLALWRANPDAGGYDAADAVTYVWLGQALLMTTGLWSAGTTDELAERIRSGQIATDLARPTGLLGWYLAADLGRASYHLLTRGLGPTLIGMLLFDITLPPGPGPVAGFLVSLVLAVVTAFAIRFIVAASAFWLNDHNGVKLLSASFAMFLSGMVLPLVIFPEPLRSIARALPWASYLQTPADLWLGKVTGWSAVGALSLQLTWAIVLLATAQGVVALATRRVVVHGG